MTQPALRSAFPLLQRAITAVLTTVMPDGRLQSTPVWFDCDGPDVLVSTMREFAKARNLARRPVATLLVVDPDDTSVWVEVRARVVVDDAGASNLLDELARRYTGTSPYFGAVVPAGLAATEHPVTARLRPSTVVRATSAGQRLADAPPRTPAAMKMPAARGHSAEIELPASHVDLLDAPIVASLATTLPGGFAQTQPVWCARDGNDVLVNTTLERRKGRNLLADPRATVLVVDPGDTSRWIEVRADVDLVAEGAEGQLDELTRAYTRHEQFYGGVYPASLRDRETRMVARLHPVAVHCDAVHR